MERTRNVITNETLGGKRLQVLSELTNRAMLMVKLGYQYEGNRNLYQALGYPTQLKFDDFLARYIRQDIAKAIIDRPVKATWQGPLELVEPDEPEDTEFEEAWEDLNRRLGMKTVFSRVDRLTGLGQYGVLLLGLNDVSNNEGFLRPVSSRATNLVYVKPFCQKSAKIETYVDDPTDERYGLPLVYSIEVADVSSGNSRTVKVHYSRVIHITDDNLESEVLGTPRLEAVFNRLMDLEKIVGGDAEMFWRGARPGYKGVVDPNYTMTDDAKKDLTDQLDEYENNLRRFLINEGVDVDTLAQQIADPTPHVDVAIQMISAQTGIPKRVLTGSERGQLASTQDTGEWLMYVQNRREDHAEPRIVRPTVDRLIELGLLPKPEEDYTVVWQDLFSISEKDRVDIGKARANALREYTTNVMAEGIMPPDVFLEKCLGFTTEEVTWVKEKRDEDIGTELMDAIKEQIENPPAQANPGTGNSPPSKSAKPTERKTATVPQKTPK